MALTKAEEFFFRDALNAGAPKPFITSLIWLARKVGIDPSWPEIEALAYELDTYFLEGRKPGDHRSSQEGLG